MCLLNTSWPQLGTWVLMIEEHKCHQAESLVLKALAPPGSLDVFLSPPGLVLNPERDPPAAAVTALLAGARGGISMCFKMT